MNAFPVHLHTYLVNAAWTPVLSRPSYFLKVVPHLVHGLAVIVTDMQRAWVGYYPTQRLVRDVLSVSLRGVVLATDTDALRLCEDCLRHQDRGDNRLELSFLAGEVMGSNNRSSSSGGGASSRRRNPPQHDADVCCGGLHGETDRCILRLGTSLELVNGHRVALSFALECRAVRSDMANPRDPAADVVAATSLLREVLWLPALSLSLGLGALLSSLLASGRVSESELHALCQQPIVRTACSTPSPVAQSHGSDNFLAMERLRSVLLANASTCVEVPGGCGEQVAAAHSLAPGESAASSKGTDHLRVLQKRVRDGDSQQATGQDRPVISTPPREPPATVARSEEEARLKKIRRVLK